jgi:hypothetical protein
MESLRKKLNSNSSKRAVTFDTVVLSDVLHLLNHHIFYLSLVVPGIFCCLIFMAN